MADGAVRSETRPPTLRSQVWLWRSQIFVAEDVVQLRMTSRNRSQTPAPLALENERSGHADQDAHWSQPVETFRRLYCIRMDDRSRRSVFDLSGQDLSIPNKATPPVQTVAGSREEADRGGNTHRRFQQRRHDRQVAWRSVLTVICLAVVAA